MKKEGVLLFSFQNGHDMQFAWTSVGLLGVVILSCIRLF